MASPRMSPLMIAAAVSVILFCGVGIASITGILPRAQSQEAPAAPAPVAATAPAPALPATPTPPDTAAVVAPVAPVAAPVEKKAPAVAAERPAHHHERKVADNSSSATSSAPACQDCGTVISVNAVQVNGSGSSAGAIGATVGGAALGGLAGHQFGNGKGNTAMTVLGAIGGALAGNTIEKNVNHSTRYDVSVRMEDGSTRTVSFTDVPPVSSGDRVHVEGDTLVRAQ